MSEHAAGSDLAAAQMRATRTDAGWRLSGTKVWTSGAHVAHQIVVLARTSPVDPDRRHAGFSQFIVPTDAPGITVSPIVLMNGEHHFNEVLFDDVTVPDTAVLGKVGDGWHQVTAELGFERSGPERFLSTATLIFAAVRALGPGADDSAAAAVGELIARVAALRQLSISVARALTAGEDANSRAALVKDLGTRFEQESVDLVADLLTASIPRVLTPPGCAPCWPRRDCRPRCSRCAAGRTRCCAASSPRAWECDERRTAAVGRRTRTAITRRARRQASPPRRVRRRRCGATSRRPG